MVFAVIAGIRQTKAPTITAIREPGIFFEIFGQKIKMARPITPTTIAQTLTVEIYFITKESFSIVSIAVSPPR